MPDDATRTPPSRPQMSDATPPPVERIPPAPGTISASRSLWFVAVAIGIAALIFGFLWRDVQVERLQEVVVDLEVDLAEGTRDRVSAVVYFASLGVLALLTAIEMFLFNRVLRQRGGFRWALLGLLLVHAVVVLAASAVVAIGEQGALIAALLVSQAVLAGAALLLSFFPSANRWFALRKKAQPAVLP